MSRKPKRLRLITGPHYAWKRIWVAGHGWMTRSEWEARFPRVPVSTGTALRVTNVNRDTRTVEVTADDA